MHSPPLNPDGQGAAFSLPSPTKNPAQQPNTFISQVLQQTLRIKKTGEVLLDVFGNYPPDMVDRSGTECFSGCEINPVHFN